MSDGTRDAAREVKVVQEQMDYFIGPDGEHLDWVFVVTNGSIAPVKAETVRRAREFIEQLVEDLPDIQLTSANEILSGLGSSLQHDTVEVPRGDLRKMVAVMNALVDLTKLVPQADQTVKGVRRLIEELLAKYGQEKEV